MTASASPMTDRASALAAETPFVPAASRPGYIRATTGKASPRQAIKAQCLQCMGYDRAGIAACTGFTCPLWDYRPFQTREDE